MLYAWFIFVLSAIFLFYQYLVFIFPVVLTRELMNTYSLSAFSLGWMVSLYFYGYLLMQFPSGLLMDRYGIRKTTACAIFLCSAGVLLFATRSSFMLLCLGRLLIGAGAAFAVTNYIKMASIWFPTSSFPMIASFFGVMCMFGAGTSEMPLAWIISQIGWQNAVLIIALFGFIFSAVVGFSFKNKQSEKQAQHPRKEHSFSVQHCKLFLKKPSNLALMFYSGFSFPPLLVFGGLWGVPYVQEVYGLSTVAAASCVSFGFFGFAAGGFLVDKVGRKFKTLFSVAAVGTLLSLLLLLLILYFHLSYWELTSVLFLFGICASSYLMTYAIVPKQNPPELLSTGMALINMTGAVLAAIAEPFIGKISGGLNILILYQAFALLCLLGAYLKTSGKKVNYPQSKIQDQQ